MLTFKYPCCCGQVGRAGRDGSEARCFLLLDKVGLGKAEVAGVQFVESIASWSVHSNSLARYVVLVCSSWWLQGGC
jgi:hypothetical protein